MPPPPPPPPEQTPNGLCVNTTAVDQASWIRICLEASGEDKWNAHVVVHPKDQNSGAPTVKVSAHGASLSTRDSCVQDQTAPQTYICTPPKQQKPGNLVFQFNVQEEEDAFTVSASFSSLEVTWDSSQVDN